MSRYGSPCTGCGRSVTYGRFPGRRAVQVYDDDLHDPYRVHDCRPAAAAPYAADYVPSRLLRPVPAERTPVSRGAVQRGLARTAHAGPYVRPEPSPVDDGLLTDRLSL